MNISTSISQVIYETRLPGKILLKKAYVWPEYNTGKIEKIQRVHEKGPELNYIKRSSFNPIQIRSAFEAANELNYTHRGHLQTLQNRYAPGSFFEAFA